MSSCTIDHKYRSRCASTKTAGELKYYSSLGERIIPLALVGYDIVIANLALRASLAISYPTRTRGIIIEMTA